MRPLNGLLTHHFNDDAFGPLSVEFRVIDLLPWAEIEFARGNRNDDFMVNEKALQVRIAVGFASPMVAVIAAKWRETLQPFVNIGDESIFGVVHMDAGGDVHCGDQNHALANAALRKSRLDLRSDVQVFSVLLRPESQVLGVELHRGDINVGTGVLDSPADARQTSD
jgi:hypothetical protein